MRVKERAGPFITLLQYILHHPRCSPGSISLQTSALSEHLDAAVVSFEEASKRPTLSYLISGNGRCYGGGILTLKSSLFFALLENRFSL